MTNPFFAVIAGAIGLVAAVNALAEAFPTFANAFRVAGIIIVVITMFFRIVL